MILNNTVINNGKVLSVTIKKTFPEYILTITYEGGVKESIDLGGLDELTTLELLDKALNLPPYGTPYGLKSL